MKKQKETKNVFIDYCIKQKQFQVVEILTQYILMLRPAKTYSYNDLICMDVEELCEIVLELTDPTIK